MSFCDTEKTSALEKDRHSASHRDRSVRIDEKILKSSVYRRFGVYRVYRACYMARASERASEPLWRTKNRSRWQEKGRTRRDGTGKRGTWLRARKEEGAVTAAATREGLHRERVCYCRLRGERGGECECALHSAPMEARENREAHEQTPCSLSRDTQVSQYNENLYPISFVYQACTTLFAEESALRRVDPFSAGTRCILRAKSR